MSTPTLSIVSEATPAEINSDERTVIKVTVDDSRLAAETVIAMAEHGDVYQRDGRIVEPWCIPSTPAEKAKSSIHDALGSYVIRLADASRIHLLISRACQFETFSRREKKIIPASIPKALPSLVAAHELPFPTLSGIAEAPTLRPDGTLISKRGYDAQTGIYLASDMVVDVPESPTREDAIKARDTLLDVICDFVFSSPASKSVWLSGVLSMVARPAINGPVPLHAWDATAPGAGKGRAVNITTIIATGRDASTVGNTIDDAEMDKRILAVAIAGMSSVLIDNVEGEIGTASLDRALTSEQVSGRVLGKSHMAGGNAGVEFRPVMFATGNRMIFRGDLPRRMVLATIDPGCERPEERTGPTTLKEWSHKDLLGHVREHRVELLSAALTLVRAYIVAGRPPQPMRQMDYAGWSDTIRGAIIWVGLPDPALTVMDVRGEDPVHEARSAFVAAWPFANGEEISVKQIIDAATKRIEQTGIAFEKAPFQLPEFAEALAQFCPPDKFVDNYPAKLGMAMKSIRGRVFDGRKIDKPKPQPADEKTKSKVSARWVRTEVFPGDHSAGTSR